MSLFAFLRRRQFEESQVDIPNPERGFYVGYNLIAGGDASRIRAAGRTLAIALVELDDYRDSLALPGAFLASLERGFGQLRTAGAKAIVRFRYSNDEGVPDAPKWIILAHIAQLATVLRLNADVIAVIQMGMVGFWGEGHSSTNGLDNDDDRSEILNAQLAAWPGCIQVRTPRMKAAYIARYGK